MNRARVKKVGSSAPLPSDMADVEAFIDDLIEQDTVKVPADWVKGQLLNVRNYGDVYRITLYPEEYDLEHPERSISFANLGECQGFVSDWYARQSHDPRAR